MMRTSIALSLTGLGMSNMIDVIDNYRAPPTNCKNGCDDWSNYDPSVWKNGKIPPNAGSNCAQPGAVVNDNILGSWCACKPDSKPQKEEPLPPASWDFIKTARCETDVKQFGETPPPGFLYDTQAGLTGSLYYKDVVTLDECQSLCHNNLTNCDFVSWGHGGWCYLAEWCQNDVPFMDYKTYHDGSKPVPPAPSPEPSNKGYCVSKKSVPEQINVQIASPTSVVLSFVTFEDSAPTSPPTASVNGTTFTGVTHNHTTSAGDRIYFMHFILLDNLKPKTTYSYKVKSGYSSSSPWSDVFSFKSLYDDGETNVNIYGDMGIYEWNAIEWLQKDCHSGAADLIVHMGDHAYNEGESDELRGDGYMNGFQPVLSECPWLPNVGNHEFYDGAELGRYLDQTWEKWGPLPKSTATSPLGYLLSAANHQGAGVGGSTPSGTSRYFSVDIGLIHFIALDLNMYYGTDACGDTCRKSQLAWLEQDLIAANKNRESKPWVIAFSHFPLFCTGCHTSQYNAYYESEEAERFGNNNATESKAWGKSAAHQKMLKDKGYKNTVGASSAASIADLHPIFEKYGLDMYVAGHWHYYESLYPSKPGNSSCPSCAVPTQKDFNKPNVTVHVTSGNGGPPGKDTFVTPIPAARFQSTDFGYGRLTAHNRTHITFTQFVNNNGSVLDSWTLYSPVHGPFSERK
eukprot:TRINITY_DN12928_c1_g1_i1.p1 TRINITY_DN12928_c1_g1~~TRINITY_DN12928_c1_g1_i1.p1  ORF type:complete len:700 (+),score=168.21 TRINITY_DN12928_c1_g1_i1:49-2100(+)